MRVLWCITGGGYLLTECLDQMETISKEHELSLLFSDAGCEVAHLYGLYDKISGLSSDVLLENEQGPSCPISGSARFKKAVVAPCTANTVAKVVNGIADSAVTNVVAQFIKRDIDVIVVPTDHEKVVSSRIPSGKVVKVHCRPVDLENVERLKKMRGITVVGDPKEIRI